MECQPSCALVGGSQVVTAVVRGGGVPEASRGAVWVAPPTWGRSQRV